MRADEIAVAVITTAALIVTLIQHRRSGGPAEPETAVLLRHGVSAETLGWLIRAGLTTVAQVARYTQTQLLNLPGIDKGAARSIVQALDSLCDAEGGGDTPHINSISATPRRDGT